MGVSSAKPIREAPVRYVARRMPRNDKTPAELQFKKPSFTAQGINTRQDDVNTEPLMYVETSKDASSTELTDHAAPRWYLNTYMEMMDNVRVNQSVISGNLPMAWERDKHEPYSLVRGRIDDEDLRWVLAPEQRKMNVEELVRHTKLDRNVLQDLLDTVEVPRVQYRNYKGKLHRSIEDVNTFTAARQSQLLKARESETLRRIGYSEEEIERDGQYLTDRPRGVKALDDIGASRREKTRQTRAAAASELEEMLEDHRREQLESGTANFTEEELLERPERLRTKARYADVRAGSYKRMYAADMNKDTANQQRLVWWLDRRRRIQRASDTIHGVPLYNDRLAANEEQTRRQMQEAADFNYTMGQAQGAKGFVDPRNHFDDLLNIMRKNKEASHADLTVNVHEGDALENPVFRFPHTKDHPQRPTSHIADSKDDTVNGATSRVDTDIHKLYGFGPITEDEESTVAVHKPTAAAGQAPSPSDDKTEKAPPLDDPKKQR